LTETQMGNCLGKSSEKPNAFNTVPIKPITQKTIDIVDEPRGPIVNVESTKKHFVEEFHEEEKKQVDENRQRNVKKGNFKIRAGADRDNEPLYEHIQKIDKQKTKQDVQNIAACLKKTFLFYNLNEVQLERIINAMFYCEVKEGELIFAQGDNASSYFILEKGRLEIIINNETKKFLEKGSGFGELALLYSAPRSASVKTAEKSCLWGIDRVTFRNVVEDLITKEYSENRKFIDAVAFFNTMTSEQKDAIASVMITLKYSKNENIVSEGEQASSFYIVKEGQISISKAGKEIRKMNQGDSFGEQALYHNSVRGATVKAVSDQVKCITLGRDALTKILGDHVQVIVYRNQQKWALEKSIVLKNLTKIQVEKMLDAMKISNHKAGDVIFRKGSACHQKIVIVLEGSLRKTKSGTIAAGKGEPYGDEFVTEAYSKRIYEEDIIFESDGVLSEISHHAFEKAIGGKIEDILVKNENSHEKRMNNMVSEIKLAGKDVQLEDLVYYKKLGAGMFGSVFLVKENQHFYALKCISKQQIVEQTLEKHLQQEKSVLEAVNFPFIMQFIKSYKDQNFIYFLTEYVKGLELYDVIRIINLLNTYESQFYVGSMILAIEYLHNKGIIYRDLKPENIMIDHTGYMKLIDMGTAKFVKGKSNTLNRTFTIIGTPHYMAPEILSGKGYTLNVDLWSIGICLYEFLCGMVPFGEDAEDPYEIHDEIMNMPLKYPNYLKDIKAKKLVDQLLNKTAEVRLNGSYAALKAHPWFDNFDWDKLLDKNLKPPLIPPKEKLISDEEIKKMEKLGKKITTVLEEENKNHKKYKKEKANDANWDKDF